MARAGCTQLARRNPSAPLSSRAGLRQRPRHSPCRPAGRRNFVGRGEDAPGGPCQAAGLARHQRPV
eukprot:3962582-Lingulodinium_polyedra.AAC.1